LRSEWLAEPCHPDNLELADLAQTLQLGGEPVEAALVDLGGG
jgi:hypothetical protein